MDIKAIRVFMEKYGSVELTDEQLELVIGGARDTSHKFLESYCKTIPVSEIRDE